MSHVVDITGQRFGRLVVLRRSANQFGTTNAHWICRCDCGGQVIVSRPNLKSGHTKSCNCLQRENQKTGSIRHGESKSPEYHAWIEMLTRCYNTNRSTHDRWGGRGIRVCDQWRDSFETFLRDVGRKPTPGHSLDRYPNPDGNYEPGNTRWATPEEQARNRRSNLRLTLNGITKILVEWVAESGLPYGAVYSRLARGWTLEDALSRPLRGRS